MASLASPRLVVVDDKDSSIFYSNSWFLDDTKQKDDVGNFGPTLQGTLHGTNSNGTFTFSFTGSDIVVYGTVNQTDLGGSEDPAWTCFVDGTPLPTAPPFKFIENNWILCSANSLNLTNAEHTLTVNVNSKGQTFWLDYLTYVPSDQDQALNGALVQIPRQDNAIIYDSGAWTPLGNLATMTTTHNASMSFTFTGRSIVWYGVIPTELPHVSATATYTIDGGPSHNFVIQQLGRRDPTLYSQRLFEVDNLSDGSHTLKVTFTGDENTAPLALQSLLVKNSTTSVTSSSSSGGSQSTTNAGTPPQLSEAAGKSNINVAGVVCGVLAVLLLALLLAFMYFRYRRQKNGQQLPTFSNPFTPARLKAMKPSFSRPPFSRPTKVTRMRQMSTLDLLAQPAIPAPQPTPGLAPTPVTAATRALPAEGYLGHPGPSRTFENVENWIQQQGGSRPRIDKQQARRTEPPPRSPPPPMTEGFDELNESYYGGYQTWAQAKELEAKVAGKQRMSYM